MITCRLCDKQFKQLSSHLRLHNLSSKQYLDKFPGEVITCKETCEKISKLNIGNKYGVGCKWTCERKEKISKLMKDNKRGVGTDRSAEQERYSLQAKTQHQNKQFGTWDEARRERQRQITKQRWIDGSLKHTWTPKWQKDLAVFFSDNNLEYIEEFILPEWNLGYRLAKPFDFYLPKHNTLIELNGCFWHGCNRCYKPHPIQTRVKLNDLEKASTAQQLGYRLLVIWEHDREKINDLVMTFLLT